MSGDFECFVTIGDKKQSIYLDKDIDSVIFSDVYKQLTQLNVKPVVSFDNYIFEVFDFEDNCFQRLTSVEMPIKYLSRIRVLPKNSNNETNNRPKSFKPKFNNNLFNTQLINENQVNEEFFNVGAEDEPKSVPKRPIRPNRWHNYNNPLYSEPTPEEVEELELNEDFYNREMHFNANKRMKFRCYGDYGADGFEYDYSGSPAPTPKPYVRRSDIIEPIAGSSFTDPYGEPLPQPYYRRRNDDYHSFMGPPEEEYPSYYRPNNQPFNFRPDSSQNMGYRHDFNQGMSFRPNFTPNFRPNFPRNPTFGYRKQMNRNPKRREQNISQHNSDSEPSNEPEFIKSPKTLNSLRINGFTLEVINGFEYYFCEFCEIKFKPVFKAFKHIQTDLHRKNSSEKNLDPLDKLLLVKTQRIGSEVPILRRQEMRKISKLDKQKLVRHGIRIKDATGPQAYICIRCCSSLSSLEDCHKHYDKFIEINKSINYPKDYHLLTEDNSLPKVELRYRRILNALELIIEDNRSEEQLKELILLRDEGVVLKESIDGSNKRYYSCLVCDKRFDTNEEAITHSKSEEHLKNRSPKRYKGLDKAFLMDSERSNQIEIVLARKQELEKIRFFTKELNIEHGIRLKDGIGPEAYFCNKCDEWFDSSNMVRIHVDHYDKRVINESTEEFLIASAKKQMELLLRGEKSKAEEPVSKPDAEEGGAEQPTLEPKNDKIVSEEPMIKSEEGVAEEPAVNTNVEEVLTEEPMIKSDGEEIVAQESAVNPKGEEIVTKEVIVKLGEEEEGDEQMDFTADEDNNFLSIENCEQRFAEEGIKTLFTNNDNRNKYYDIFCDIYFKDEEQAVYHLNRSFHKRIMSGEFLSSIDKTFCVSTNRINEIEVALSRIQVLERLADEVKQKFTEEGIRLKDGIGREAFWCLLCNDSILSPNVESGSYSFINHINYNPKHVELLIGQNK